MSKLKELKRVVVKEELVALTGDLEQGIMLQQFIYWSERIRDFDKFIAEEKARVEKENLEEVNIDYQNGWIYKDMEELKDEVMLTSSISTISRKLNNLVKKGWLHRRNNPKFKWDKRYQYRVDLNKISTDLFELGYILQDYKINITELLKQPNLQNENTNLQGERTAKNANLQNESSDLQNESSDLQNDKALSEITTEITTEITSVSQEEKDRLKKQHEMICGKCQTYLFEDIKDMKLIENAILDLVYLRELNVKNKVYNNEEIMDKLNQLDFSICYYALDKFKEAKDEIYIKNKAKYFSILLFNAIDEYYAE